MPITKYPTFIDTLNLICMMNVFGITIAACLCFYLSTRRTKFPTCSICLNICIRCKSIFYKEDSKKVVPAEVQTLPHPSIDSKLISDSKIARASHGQMLFIYILR